MKKASLRTKLSMAFMLFALVLFVLIIVFANLIMDKQFEAYTVSKLEKTIQNTVSLIESRFENPDNWNQSAIEDIGMSALSGGLMLRVTSADGTKIWDAWEHNNGFCTEMLQNMAMNMQSYDSSFQGGYREETYPITADGQTAGSVVVGYYGPYFYSDTDIQFLNGLKKAGDVGEVSDERAQSQLSSGDHPAAEPEDNGCRGHAQKVDGREKSHRECNSVDVRVAVRAVHLVKAFVRYILLRKGLDHPDT
jgi:hypothetical protein